MIFATVGTHQQPFPRLLEALATLDDEVVVQYGHAARPEGIVQAEAFMAYERVLALIERASRVVTHAGVGSVLCARAAGHTPVVVPRLARLGEHVDDHQSELARALAKRGEVVVWETGRLAEAVERAGARGARRPLAPTALHGALHELISSDRRNDWSPNPPPRLLARSRGRMEQQMPHFARVLSRRDHEVTVGDLGHLDDSR